jgi:hypothetical protein
MAARKFTLSPSTEEENLLDAPEAAPMKRSGMESAAAALERTRRSDQADFEQLFPQGSAGPRTAAPAPMAPVAPLPRPMASTAERMIRAQTQANAPLIEAEAASVREASRTAGLGVRTVGSGRNERQVRSGVAPSKADFDAKASNPFDTGFFKPAGQRAGMQSIAPLAPLPRPMASPMRMNTMSNGDGTLTRTLPPNPYGTGMATTRMAPMARPMAMTPGVNATAAMQQPATMRMTPPMPRPKPAMMSRTAAPVRKRNPFKA